MASESRLTVLPVITVPVVTIRPLLPGRLLMFMVVEALNVPSDVTARGSKTAAWLKMVHRQYATVQTRMIHRIYAIRSLLEPHNSLSHFRHPRGLPPHAILIAGFARG
jgi:hypothetical protein